MTQISLMIGRVVVCPLAECNWMAHLLDHDLLADHLRDHEDVLQASALGLMIDQIASGGEPPIFAEAVMYKVGHAD